MPNVGEIIQRTFEKISQRLSLINHIHANIHDGISFAAEYDFGVVLKDGGTSEVLLQIPADNYVHLYEHNFNPDAQPGQVEIFEGTTFSAEGTTMEAENLNRISGKTSNIAVTHTPTITADGTRIDIIGKTASKNSSDNSVKYVEWNLMPDTNYLIRYTNKSTADTTVCVAKMAWYEN